MWSNATPKKKKLFILIANGDVISCSTENTCEITWVYLFLLLKLFFSFLCHKNSCLHHQKMKYLQASFVVVLM